ncbi:hypothetical protein GCM10010411_78620 [Actinomadura fulvescens]|uniref:Uncharacterized protein n=1 Tax=Actinomadura fulvescens TaxID=46160 RepID=A0ABN3QLE6_9ACTN
MPKPTCPGAYEDTIAISMATYVSATAGHARTFVAVRRQWREHAVSSRISR